MRDFLYYNSFIEESSKMKIKWILFCYSIDLHYLCSTKLDNNTLY